MSKMQPSKAQTVIRKRKAPGHFPTFARAAPAIPIITQKPSLPITGQAERIRTSLRSKDVLLLVAATGSGKTTQVPQLLLNEPWNHSCVAITQPRRVAATSLAHRVASELGEGIGNRVGYSVRFDNWSSKRTKVKFLTEGTLLHEILADPWLTKYSAVIVDEVHERSVNVDLILGLILRIVTGDQERHRHGRRLKVVVMSATADIESLFNFFQQGFGGEKVEFSLLEPFSLPKFTLPNANGHRDVPPSDIDTEDVTAQPKRKKKHKQNSLINQLTAGYANQPEPSVADEKAIAPSQPPQQIPSASDAHTSLPQSTYINIIHVEGSHHPVKIKYSDKPQPNYLQTALQKIFDIHRNEPLPGDILVFLPGQSNIEALESMVKEWSAQLDPAAPKLTTLPLFAALPSSKQDLIFTLPPPNTRRLILSTNIAETSVTIPGIRHVIDSGLHKIKQHRAALGMSTLDIVPISRSSAVQRAGRAGREAPGTCTRLYTEAAFRAMAHHARPQILLAELSAPLLLLMAQRIPRLAHFEWLTQPDARACRRALADLHLFHALDDSMTITPAGRAMVRMPLQPSEARVLIAAADECAKAVPATDNDDSETSQLLLLDAIDVISAISAENVFLEMDTEERREAARAARQKLLRREGDHLTLLATVEGFVGAGNSKQLRKAWAREHFVSLRAMNEVLRTRKQLREVCARLKLLPKEAVGGLRPTKGAVAGGTERRRRQGDSHRKNEIDEDDDDDNENSADGVIALDNDGASESASKGGNSAPSRPYSPERAERLLKCLVAGFASNFARLMPDGSYRTVPGDHAITIHPSSVLYGRKVEAIVYNELNFTKRAYAKVVSAVQCDWFDQVIQGGFGVAG